MGDQVRHPSPGTLARETSGTAAVTVTMAVTVTLTMAVDPARTGEVRWAGSAGLTPE
jgi:hypothetical protein